jgi:hypothetical protein
MTCAPTVARGPIRVDLEGDVAAPTKLVVHDLQGRIVRVLGDGAGLPSARHLEWDLADSRGSRVQPGLYFVRLSTPVRSLSQRVIVVR